jgi:hypothetical protein
MLSASTLNYPAPFDGLRTNDWGVHGHPVFQDFTEI